MEQSELLAGAFEALSLKSVSSLAQFRRDCSEMQSNLAAIDPFPSQTQVSLNKLTTLI